MKKATQRLLYLYIFLMFMALSMGRISYWMPVIVLTLVIGYSFLSAYLAKTNMHIVQNNSEKLVARGDVLNIEISIDTGTIFPIAPVKLHIIDHNLESRVIEIDSRLSNPSYEFMARHVGKYYPGIEYCLVSDIFGMFEFKVDSESKSQPIYVSPKIFPVEDIKFGVGDMGAETIKRAQEDMSSPSGIRKYQFGDPLKKIHWKLSMRKQEIMVRQYEEPTLPSTLILMDASSPHVSENADTETLASLKDGVLETAASMAYSQVKLKNKVKLPILGSSPFIYTSDMGFKVLLERLSTVSFDENTRFERFIFYEMANIRQAGAVVIITTRLTSALIEVVGQVAQKGPVVRLYLVTLNKDNPAYEPMVAKLQSRSVEVCYVEADNYEYEDIEA